MERREPEQLNNKDTSEEFALEDILREFGGEPKETEKPEEASEEAPKQPLSRDTMVFKPIRSAPAPTEGDAPVKVFSGKKPVPVVRNAAKIDDEPE